MKINSRARIGIMMCGHSEYWSQYPGMREGLIAHNKLLEDIVIKSGAELVGSRFVDTPESSYEAGAYFRTQDIDLLFINGAHYCGSGHFIPGAITIGCPIVLTAIFSEALRDEAAGLPASERYSRISAAGHIIVIEGSSVLRRCGRPEAGFVSGSIESGAETQIIEWCRAAGVARAFRGAMFGSLGYIYPTMMDLTYNPLSVTRSFNSYVKMLDMCELSEYIDEASEGDVKAQLDFINESFLFEYENAGNSLAGRALTRDDLDYNARVTVGLRKFVNKNNLSGLAFYYVGRGSNDYQRIFANLNVPGSIIAAESGLAIATEGDMRATLAIYLATALGYPASFSELGGLNVAESTLVTGHDGPHNLRVYSGKPTITAFKWSGGKNGSGISVGDPLKAGPVTIISLMEYPDGQYRFVIAEGESLQDNIGNRGRTTTTCRFKNAKDLYEKWTVSGVSHHQGVATGHCASLIEKYGKIAGIDVLWL